MGGNGNQWFNVLAAGKSGWVDSTYLELTGSLVAPPDPEPIPAPKVAILAIGTWAQVSGTAGTTGLNLRGAASPAERQLAVLPEGTKLNVLEGPTTGTNGDPWYRVAWNGSWGWVDGIRKSFDGDSFLQRYTPRRKTSVWSQINRDNVERLTEAGLMRPPGRAEVDRAKADGRWDAAYSVSKTAPPDDLINAIEAEPAAAEFYRTLSAQNRFALTFRTIQMKTEAGRRKKIEDLVAMLKRRQTIYPQGRK